MADKPWITEKGQVQKYYNLSRWLLELNKKLQKSLPEIWIRGVSRNRSNGKVLWKYPIFELIIPKICNNTQFLKQYLIFSEKKFCYWVLGIYVINKTWFEMSLFFLHSKPAKVPYLYLLHSGTTANYCGVPPLYNDFVVITT